MKLNKIADQWDLIVIGGGITGAGIFREATRMGLRTILIEQRDFAWGTSSRSSKLVHGGLRYLKEGHFKMTKIAVEERERLLKEAPGLVESLKFLLPIYEDQRPGRRTMQVGLSLYDIMARERQHHYYEREKFRQLVPQINPNGLKGGFPGGIGCAKLACLEKTAFQAIQMLLGWRQHSTIMKINLPSTICELFHICSPFV